nr:formin-like protein 14 [Aegilops tauschii subsp. strangulata]
MPAACCYCCCCICDPPRPRPPYPAAGPAPAVAVVAAPDLPPAAARRLRRRRPRPTAPASPACRQSQRPPPGRLAHTGRADAPAPVALRRPPPTSFAVRTTAPVAPAPTGCVGRACSAPAPASYRYRAGDGYARIACSGCGR